MSIITKICGITSPEALDAAIDGGADCIGLVFFSKSPRNIEISQARDLASRARGKAEVVALTVDASDEAIERIVQEVGPDVLQLHGSETPERVAAIKQRFQRKVIKAIPVATVDDVARAHDYTGVADLILFDAKGVSGSDLPGGNGRTFDWSALDGWPAGIPFMLSGGLDPENVSAAITRTHPAAVDVSSGVEVSPGVKDPQRIRRFLQAAKTAKQM
jgi:phosphoribosylanthranilate isomerase